MEIFSVWLIRQKQALKALQLQTLSGRKKGPARSAVRGSGVAVAFAIGDCAMGGTGLPGPVPAARLHADHPFGKHTLPDLNPDAQQDLNSLQASSGEERLWAVMGRPAAWGKRMGRGSQPALDMMHPAMNLPEFLWIRTPSHTGTPGMSSRSLKE